MAGLKVADEEYLKVRSLRNREKIQQGQVTEPERCIRLSVDPCTVHCSIIRRGLSGSVAVKKLFLRKGNGKKDRVHQIIQELN